MYVRIKSWHRVRTFTRVPGGAVTRCGLQVRGASFLDELPLDQKSCETCLRLTQRDLEDES